MFGDGEQVRCFCHVHDVVPALHGADGGPEAYGEVFNVGNSEQITITQLAERVRAVTGSSSSITYVPYEPAYGAGFEDMQRRVPDCTRARQLIGFRPAGRWPTSSRMSRRSSWQPALGVGHVRVRLGEPATATE